MVAFTGAGQVLFVRHPRDFGALSEKVFSLVQQGFSSSDGSDNFQFPLLLFSLGGGGVGTHDYDLVSKSIVMTTWLIDETF